MNHKDFFTYLENSEKKIIEFMVNNELKLFFKPDDIYDSIFSYILSPAKRLRPCILLMACGSVGGEEREKMAIPAAVGIELFHTWTLVHDDLIDNDHLRRGKPTIHEAISKKYKKNFAFNDELAEEYGRDIAILTGDMHHGWSVSSFVDLSLNMPIDPVLILKIIKHLESYILSNLIYGEVLDVQYGMRDAKEISDIDEDKIVYMLWLKTGILYEFAGLAGALIGKNTTNFEDEQVKALKYFTSNCGTAFQLQDDILGILGDERTLGKPVGSDIKEGKKTVIMYESLKNANEAQKKRIYSILGNKKASFNEIKEITRLFQELGGIDRSKYLANSYIEKALPYLEAIDDSKYKKLLISWADFMVNRKY
jgi:geranylgeranyl diphosphate synthase, type I